MGGLNDPLENNILFLQSKQKHKHYLKKLKLIRSMLHNAENKI